MSLYGGIKFTAGDGGKDTGVSSSVESKADAGPSTAAPKASELPLPGPSNAKGTEKARPPSHSAALKFAPRINKAKPAPRPTAGIITTVYSALPTTSSSSNPASTRLNRNDKDNASASEEQVQFGTDGRALAKAPAMTLTRPVNENRKRKKKKRRRGPVFPTFDPDEQYDPNRPNDLGEYQHYRKKVKEERIQRYLEEKRRRADGEESEASSYYTSSEDDAPRRDAPKLWAPPKLYSPPRSIAPSRPFAAAPADSPPPPPPPPSVPGSGNDAYARRLAMSQQNTGEGEDVYAQRAARSAAEISADEAYARRAAMSQFRPPQPPQGIPPPPPPLESYQPPPPPPPPPVAQSPTPPPVNMPPFPPSAPPPGPAAGVPPSRPFVPPPANLVAAAPGFRPPPNLPPFPPRTAPRAALSVSVPAPAAPLVPAPAPAPPPAEPTPEQIEFDLKLAERKAAAEAIAAKFAALTGAPATPAPVEDIPGQSFAEKMMRRWGHKEGSGLGAKGEGIVHALTAEHVTGQIKGTGPGGQLSKRQIAKQKTAAANAKASGKKWVQHANARGRIVNANEEERRVEEVEKYGEASRVLCLVGLVNDLDEVDEDLAEEIGEECSKYGIVERVVLHMVEPPPPDPSSGLRVFVVFSGMAGAWRSLRELDGRFFGGRTVRATYFDEKRFDSGDRDGPVR